MDQLSKRLLIIALLVSFIFSSSAQNASSTEEDTSSDSDIQLLSNCDPKTGVCSVPEKDLQVTKEAAVTDHQEDTTELYEPSTGPARGICMPGTTLCIPPKKEALTDHEDAPIICDPITDICNGANTINSVVPEPAAKGHDLPKPDNPTNNIVCTPGTRNCGHPKDEL